MFSYHCKYDYGCVVVIFVEQRLLESIDLNPGGCCILNLSHFNVHQLIIIGYGGGWFYESDPNYYGLSDTRYNIY